MGEELAEGFRKPIKRVFCSAAIWKAAMDELDMTNSSLANLRYGCVT